MRWIITICVFYLIALTFLPCSDALNKCRDTISKIETAQSQDHNQDSDDSCSPFCSCNCCSVSIASYNFKPFAINHPKVAFITKKITLRDFTLISYYYGSIWHPPQFTV